ncbi:MAG: hypothetical protein J2P48_02275 [Alphaproteobacteria bacterium]|nr:hypothetical protein [Alphaproteobacteria bacterium]
MLVIAITEQQVPLAAAFYIRRASSSALAVISHQRPRGSRSPTRQHGLGEWSIEYMLARGIGPPD